LPWEAGGALVCGGTLQYHHSDVKETPPGSKRGVIEEQSGREKRTVIKTRTEENRRPVGVSF